MAKSNHTDRVSVKPICDTNPHDEGMLRLHLAEQVASYVAVNESRESDDGATSHITADVAYAIQALISDARTLLNQAHSEAREVKHG